MGAECRDPSEQKPQQPFARVLVSDRRGTHLIQMLKIRAKDSGLEGRGGGWDGDRGGDRKCSLIKCEAETTGRGDSPECGLVKNRSPRLPLSAVASPTLTRLDLRPTQCKVACLVYSNCNSRIT